MPFIRIFSVFLLVFCFSTGKAQFLAGFSALQQNKNIELNIVIAGGNTCNGINILRSTDGINFEPVGDIAGICGSSTEDVFYSYTDTDPVPNVINYYRLDLITLGYSSIINIRYVDVEYGKLLIHPNPIQQKASVYLQAGNSDLSSYRIIDRFGRILRQVDGIRGNFFELQREDLPPGLYYLEVQTGSRKPVVSSFIIIY